jgi:hypothetical protein
MKLADRFLRVIVVRHLDERKPACASGGLIAHHADVIDGSSTTEKLRQFFIGGLIREVAYVQSAAHRCETLSRASISKAVTRRRASDVTPSDALATDGLRGHIRFRNATCGRMGFIDEADSGYEPRVRHFSAHRCAFRTPRPRSIKQKTIHRPLKSRNNAQFDSNIDRTGEPRLIRFCQHD